MKKRYLGLLAMSTVLTLGLVAVNEHNSNVVDAASATFDFTKQNYSNQTAVTSATLDSNVTAVFAGGGNNNVPKYYTSGSAVRMYPKNSITVKVGEGYEISSISFGHTSGYSFTNITPVVTNGTLVAATSTSSQIEATDGATEVVIQINPNVTSGNVRLTNMSVEYTEVGSGSTEPENPVEKTPTEEVNELFAEYYNNGVYKRDTVININDSVVGDLLKYGCFHNGIGLLERETYFVNEELWMSNEANTWSYYGTSDSNMTSARVENKLYQPTKVTTAYTGHTMEDHYTTLYDIKDNEATWTKEGNVYSTSDADVVKYFLDFTAPCFYGLNETTKKYWTMTSVEVEEIEGCLELRLVTSGDEGKLTDANGYLSVATITKGAYKKTITNVADALTSADDTPVALTGIVGSYYTSGNNSFLLEDEEGNYIVVYAPQTSVSLNDKVSVVGLKTTYQGTKQVASGSTVTILEESGFEPQTHKVSIEEAHNIGSDLAASYITGDLYTVTAEVTYNGGNYYLTNGIESIQLYKGTVEGLHENCTATVTGNITRYNTTVEFVNYTIDEIIPCTYNFTIPTFENGSITASLTTNVPYGTEVTFTATPETGYKLASWSIDGAPLTVVDGVNTATVTINGIPTIEASFVEENVVVEKEEKTATLSFADKANRTEYSTSKQVWAQNGVVLTNNKSSSTNNVGDYSSPARFYKNSEIIITAPLNAEITKIVFTTVSGYNIGDSISSTSNYTVTKSGTTITVVFTTPVTEFTAKMTAGQARLSSMIVTYLG